MTARASQVPLAHHLLRVTACHHRRWHAQVALYRRRFGAESLRNEAGGDNSFGKIPECHSVRALTVGHVVVFSLMSGVQDRIVRYRSWPIRGARRIRLTPVFARHRRPKGATAVRRTPSVATSLWHAALDMGLGRKTFPTFATGLEGTWIRRVLS